MILKRNLGSLSLFKVIIIYVSYIILQLGLVFAFTFFFLDYLKNGTILPITIERISFLSTMIIITLALYNLNYVSPGLNKDLNLNLVVIISSLSIGLIARILFSLLGLTSSNFRMDLALDIDSAVALISTLIISPIGEEFFFRGVIFKGLLLSGRRVIVAIIVSSLLFGLVHFSSPIDIVRSFIFGIILSLYYYKTKSLTGTMLIHMMYNLSWILAPELYF